MLEIEREGYALEMEKRRALEMEKGYALGVKGGGGWTVPESSR